MSKPSRLTAIMACIVTAVFLFCTRQAIFIGFDRDDLMNLDDSWMSSFSSFLTALIFPFTTLNRPTGAAYYRICFALLGWHPGGFRAITYLFLLLNVGLVALLARRLSGSREIAFLAALLFSFHGRLWQFYVSNGTVYDVLCAFFSLAALCYYVIGRESGELSRLRSLAVVALFILALNAKEMAVVVPVLFAAYEWIYKQRAVRNYRLALITLCISAGALWGKTRAGGPFSNPAYALSFTWERFAGNSRSLYSELFYLHDKALVGREVIALWICLFALAAVLRNKTLRFGALFAAIAPLPVMFIPYRGFFPMYLALAPWAICIATLLVRIRTKLAPSRIGQLGVAGLVIVAVIAGTGDERFRMAKVDPYSMIIEAAKMDFIRLNEPLPPGAHLLLLNSRWPPDQWGPLMTARLLYRDRRLWLDRPTMMDHPPDLSRYDRILDFDGKQLVVVKRSNTPRTVPGPEMESPY